MRSRRRKRGRSGLGCGGLASDASVGVSSLHSTLDCLTCRNPPLALFAKRIDAPSNRRGTTAVTPAHAAGRSP